MSTHEISVKLSKSLYEFVEECQKSKQYKSRSDVISEALKLLSEKHLEACYREANNENVTDWDNTLLDGLEKETH